MIAPTGTGKTEVWGAQRLLFSQKETALLLNLSLRQIKRLIANDRLRATRIGSRCLIAKDEVIRFSQNTLPYCGPRN